MRIVSYVCSRWPGRGVQAYICVCIGNDDVDEKSTAGVMIGRPLAFQKETIQRINK
jgi:hypothetical protein